MNFTATVTVFAVGIVIMAPVGPVSTLCVRTTLMSGPLAGTFAGAGSALAVCMYAEIGVTSSAYFTRFIAPYALAWHLGIALLLFFAAALFWRAHPALPEPLGAPSHASLAAGFGAALALTLANPTDVVLFAAIFEALGIGVHSWIDHATFGAAIFTGGCVYWSAIASLVNRWRAAITSHHIVWLNRACSALCMVTAIMSLASLR